MGDLDRLALADNRANVALLVALDAAVPLWMLELARMPRGQRDHDRQVWARQAAGIVASRGDQLMYATKRRRPTTGTCLHCGQTIRPDDRYQSTWIHDGDARGVRCDPDALAKWRAKTTAPHGSVAEPVDDGGGTADTFNHLARGLAALAYQPGGVDFAGRHWCADHRACQAAATEAEARHA